jgi:hypothetical protein
MTDARDTDIIIDLDEPEVEDQDDDSSAEETGTALITLDEDGNELAVAAPPKYVDPECGHERESAGYYRCEYCEEKPCCCTCPDDETLAENIEQATQDLVRMNREMEENLQQLAVEGASTGTDLITRDDPMTIKQRMGGIQKRTREMRKALKGKMAELKTMKKMQLERMEAELLPAMRKAELMVARMQEGIESINLYLGTREDIVQLMEGTPCDASEPIVLRQRVLAMDEETMIASEDGGLAYADIDKFDEWLLADPSHLEQVLPQRKGVVAFVSRWDDKKTGRRSYEEDDRNRWTYFLIRNGENLYRIRIDEFKAGRRIIRTVADFNDVFTRTDSRTKQRVKLAPGTPEWERAEEAADAKTRHYMKIGLVLQGLVDRTGVLRPLPNEQVSFLHEASYLAGHIEALTDDEMVLTTGEESFSEWRERLLSEMRPGMRIIGAFNSVAWRDATYEGERGALDEDYEPRVSPKSASHPIDGVPYMIDSIAPNGGLKFKYKRTDKISRKREVPSDNPLAGTPYPGKPGYIYSRTMTEWYEEEPKTRATCTVYPWDGFILPFDLATVEDMRRFLTQRSDRQHYVTMLPLIRSALAAKEAEAEAEAPLRQLVVGALAKENDVSVEDAQEEVDSLILWYKYTNKIHRSLTEDETKAIKMMVTEHARRLKAKKADAKVVEMILDIHRDALLVARRRDGRYTVYTPQTTGNVFVTVHDFGPRTGFKDAQEWQVVNARSVAKWDIAYTSEAWANWNRKADARDHLTDPEFEEALERIKAKYKGRKVLAMSKYTYWSKDRPKVTVEVFVTRGEFKSDLERPLSGKWDEADLLQYNHKLRRNTDGSVRVRDPFSPNNLRDGGWAHRGFDRNNEPRRRSWEDSENRQLLFTNDKIIAAYDAARDQHREDEAHRERYQKRAQRALNSLWTGWDALRWEEKRAKFIEEYMDPDLWEDSKKGMKIEEYPCKRYANQARLPWENAIRRLVEQDVDLNGKTVGEVLAVLTPAVPAPDTTFGELTADEVRERLSHYKTDFTEDHWPTDRIHSLVFNYPEPEDDK